MLSTASSMRSRSSNSSAARPATDGSALGLFILDLYTRDTKRGGAWMNSIVSQSRLRGTSPVVVNNLNVSKPAPGKPTLLSLDEVTTLFHEFGHALHGLFATVTYPHFAGTNVASSPSSCVSPTEQPKDAAMSC